ncbi:hypothetical protein VXM60_04250 [Shewanella khirikhana]|uniref:hypothetical protein n=1 Tax=Shewanella khirikhana TaxID=1965282 RepID=UPI0030D54F23
MKWTSENSAQGRLELGSRAALLVVGAIPLIPTLIFGLLGFDGDTERVLIWAVAASLSWHCLFARHQIVLDKGKGLLTRRISSLYPIWVMQLKLNDIQGFMVANTLGSRRCVLIALCKNGERVELLSGHKSTMLAAGNQLADFSDKAIAEG